MWLAVPLLIPLHGAGALQIREATVRVGCGRPTLIVLGVAYELAEDGLGLQALTSPTLYNLAAWGTARGRFQHLYIRFDLDRLIPPALQDRFIREADVLTPDIPTDVHTVDVPHVGPFGHPDLLGILEHLEDRAATPAAHHHARTDPELVERSAARLGRFVTGLENPQPKDCQWPRLVWIT